MYSNGVMVDIASLAQNQYTEGNTAVHTFSPLWLNLVQAPPPKRAQARTTYSLLDAHADIFPVDATRPTFAKEVKTEC